MMMLEWEGKALLRQAGVTVPAGQVVQRGSEMAPFDGPVAVKAQVRSGGRGKSGGIMRAATPDAASRTVDELMALRFAGEAPEAVLIEGWQAMARELYLSVVIDGAAAGYALLYAPEGGMDIEAGAPPARYDIGPARNFRAWHFRAAIAAVEADIAVRERVVMLGERLVRLAGARDCTTIEINPLAVLEDGTLMALDAKVVRDDWAHFRQQDIALMLEADKRRQPPLVQACMDMQHMYVPLDGDVAVISGGAGMTMGVMDMIKDLGGAPACFLDCSPGPASTRGYRPAFAMLDADPTVKVILVSVFGGGTHMDRVASAMRDILPTRASTKPVVFRLDGTHVDQVDAILADVGARNHSSLEAAVSEAVRLAREVA
jgi:succinyl-CoA synthetase beta subunit